MKRIFFAFCLTFLVAVGLNAQPVGEFSYDGHSRRMYAGSEMRYAFDKFGAKRYPEWRDSLRGAIAGALGMDVIARANPGFVPEAVQLDMEDLGYAVRQRWKIKTEEDVWLPVIIMFPKGVNGPVPLLLTPHGHAKNTERAAGVYMNEEDRKKGEEGERDIAVQAAKFGFVAIAPTERGFGETRSATDITADNTSSCRDLMLRDLLVGRTPVGDRVWDIMRILDWALVNLPVDSRNVIITGNSGGGTVSLYAAALDERISMSLPGSAFATFEGSIGFRRHCECNYIPGILNLCEAGEIAGLTAPRPFCAVNGAYDKLFPIESAREAFSVTKEIYGASGSPDNCELYVGDGGHRYYKKGAWDFIFRHLVK